MATSFDIAEDDHPSILKRPSSCSIKLYSSALVANALHNTPRFKVAAADHRVILKMQLEAGMPTSTECVGIGVL
jgi:hypothetical protein